MTRAKVHWSTQVDMEHPVPEGMWFRSNPEVVVLSVRRGNIKNFNYLVTDPSTREAVVIDPAWEMYKIDGAIADAGATLRHVLVTHAHPDHINLACEVSKRYNCPIWMSPQEIRASGFSAPRLSPILHAWQIGGTKIEPILTPGHTPGCVCFLAGDNLFTGDVLFAEGCGICPDVEAAHAMYHSLCELKRTIPRHIRVYPGHSFGTPPGQTMSRLLKDNIYLQFRSADTFVAFRMRPQQNRARLFDFK